MSLHALKTRIPDDADRAEHCASVLKAVAHPLRLRIVAALCQGEEHVNALAERLGASPPRSSAAFQRPSGSGRISAA